MLGGGAHGALPEPMKSNCAVGSHLCGPCLRRGATRYVAHEGPIFATIRQDRVSGHYGVAKSFFQRGLGGAP